MRLHWCGGSCYLCSQSCAKAGRSILIGHPVAPGTPDERISLGFCDMTTTHQRNRRILEMRAQGLKRKWIASLFRITPGRVAMIEQRAATDQAQSEERCELQVELRIADDLDKTWPVLNLLNALHLLPVARTRLLAHSAEQHKTRMSLREFMDLVVPEDCDPSEVLARSPLLHVSGIGKISFESVAAELTETDLGPRCNEEWQRRLVVLRRVWRIPSWPPNPRRREG